MSNTDSSQWSTSPSVTLCSATLGEDGKIEPPLGPLYIAAALEEMGIRVDFRDFQLCPHANVFSGRELARFLCDHQTFVLISCFVDMLPAVIDAARLLVEERPETQVILGGPGPTAGASEILVRFPWLQGIVRGEGEKTIQEWAVRQGLSARPRIETHTVQDGGINHPEKSSQSFGVYCQSTMDTPISGMVYRHRDGNIMDGSSRHRLSDLDAQVQPAYHLLNWSHYSHARVITTRGCSYSCSFCDVAALWGHRSTFRTVQDTINEMARLRDQYGKRAIAIVDDTFVLNVKRVEQFCLALIHGEYNITWGCFGRINLMTPKLIELMARAGCNSIFYGIDSGSPEVLKRTAKKIRAESIIPVLRNSASHFERIEASFIWGYPFETLTDFNATLELAGEASLLSPRVNIQMHMLSPLPNSPIFHDFAGELSPPEPEDAPWLLLPNILQDARSDRVREIVLSAPDLFPGFFTFPTPDKHSKRQLLERALRSLQRTLGDTILDTRIARLLHYDDSSVEQEILGRVQHPSDRIGAGLAIGLLQRTRRGETYHSGQPTQGNNLAISAHTRGPSFVRQRNDGTWSPNGS
jgi:anaerobic magnesium-protoporphyrin IX monomethyl ester cyclase